MTYEQEVLQRLSVLETLMAEHTKQDLLMHERLNGSMMRIADEIASLKIKDAVIGVKLGLWGGLAGVIGMVTVLVSKMV